MTDPSEPTPPDDRPTPDDAVSAYLDGEATAEEIARVESDPALSARLARFAEISSGVRDVPAPPPGAVDDHVAAALAALPASSGDQGDAGEAGGGDAPGGASVADRRDARFWQRLPLGLVAAAAALVIVAGVMGLVGTTGDDTDTAAMDLEVEDDGDPSAGGSTGAGGGDLRATLEAPEAAQAGPRPSFSDADALADHLRAQLDAGTTSADADDAPTPTGGGSEDAGATTESAAAPEEAADPCGAVELLRLPPESVVAVVPIVLEDRPATAVVHVTDDERRLVVIDDQRCTATVDRPL